MAGSFKRLRLLGERGAATVETAIMMIVLVPLTLFVLFTSDAVYHLLEAQEAVVATIWDFSQSGWGTSKSGAAGVGDQIAETIAGFNRIQYADHDSSFTNENANFNAEDHHTQGFAHFCWCNGGDCSTETPYNSNRSHQVLCRMRRGGAAESFSLDVLGGTGNFRNKFSEGGVVECWAKGWLINYLIPGQFLEEFSSNALFNKTRREGSIHGNSDSAGANTDILLRARAGLLVDTWALAPHVDVKIAETDSVFFERTKAVFQYFPWYTVATGGVGAYAAQALQKKLIAVPSIPYGPPGIAGLPNPLGLWMVAKYDHGGGNLSKYKFKPNDIMRINEGLDLFGKELFTTPIYDETLQAWNRRGRYYMGSRTAQQQ